MQFGFKRGAAALTLSQTNWERGVCRVLRSDADAVFFFLRDWCCGAPSGFRQCVQPLVPRHWSCHMLCAMISVPLRASTQLQSAVSRSVSISSPRTYRHFFSCVE